MKYKAKSLLTTSEFNFERQLKSAFPNYLIDPQVDLLIFRNKNEPFCIIDRIDCMSTTKRSMQEARRLIGGQMLLDGHDVDEVMEALHVAKSTVYEWKDRLEADGLAGLHRKGRSGRSSKLTDNEKDELKEIIRNGAIAYGYPNEQWTSKRVRLVIFERFHVEYNSNYVCELISTLGFSQQIPQVYSINRNQEAIDHWKRYIWPSIKKKQGMRMRS
jgi:putative transposase